jgi:hypothetical protein
MSSTSGGDDKVVPTTSRITTRPSSAIEAFVAAAKSGAAPGGRGRLLFALDATKSRLPTWDMARGLTGDMIREAASVGRLSLQLVFFRGGSDGPKECAASDWTSDPARLAHMMTKVECRAGYTQINRILAHARRETAKMKVGAVVLIGDACESVEDNLDLLSGEASELGKLKTPVFAFLEGRDYTAEAAFHKIAELSGGAYGRFDASGVRQLGDLLRAAAVVAVGGVQALEKRSDAGSRLLLAQMKRGR